jgi:hypothetical protein
MTASNADESSTALFEFTLGGLTPLRNQLVYQGLAGFQILPSATLRAFDSAFHTGDPQFVILHPGKDFVSYIDAESLSECRGYHHPPIFIYFQFGRSCHDASPSK